MKLAIGFAAPLLLCTTFALAQQSTAPATTPPATTTPTTSDLPDSPASQVKAPLQPTGATAVFDTTMGRIVCRFFDKQAPQNVANFMGLATGSKDWQDPTTHKVMHHLPLYNGTEFHRVIPLFMVQGGDPTATGTGDPGYFTRDEFDPDLNFDVPGRLAMANSGANTNGSQFFITENPEEDLDQKYTIIGQCDAPGVLVVKTIARVERGSRDKPLTPVLLNKVTIVATGEPLPQAPVITPPAATPATPAFGIPGATLPPPASPR